MIRLISYEHHKPCCSQRLVSSISLFNESINIWDQITENKEVKGIVKSAMSFVEGLGYEPLKLDASCQLLQQISQITSAKFENDPDKNKPLRPTMLWLRDEGAILKDISLKLRKEALRDQIIREYEEQKEALLRIGMGFIPTHP